jgi:hypothetical protein
VTILSQSKDVQNGRYVSTVLGELNGGAEVMRTARVQLMLSPYQTYQHLPHPFILLIREIPVVDGWMWECCGFFGQGA